MQVAHSTDEGLTWSSFKLLLFEGVGAPQFKNNIYYMNVQPAGERLLAVFPAVLDDAGGVWVATSSDGEHWSRPLRVFASKVIDGRTDDHPAGLVLRAGSELAGDGQRAALYVLRGVNIDDRSSVGNKEYAEHVPPILCRYDFVCGAMGTTGLCGTSRGRPAGWPHPRGHPKREPRTAEASRRLKEEHPLNKSKSDVFGYIEENVHRAR